MTGRRTGLARLAAARSAMDQAGFDALLLINSTNLLYLTGYPVLELTLARPFYLLVPRRGEAVLLVHEGRIAEARRYAWIHDVRAYPRLSVAPVEAIIAITAEMGITTGRIGAELGFEQRMGIPVAEFERLRSALAPAIVEDAAGLLWGLRAVKSADDLAAMRRACRITADAYEATFASTTAGMTDAHVVARMRTAMADAGGDAPWVLMTAGAGNYELATGSPVGRILETGDMVWMDSGCSIGGFWSDFSRAGVLGGATAEQSEAQRLVWEATVVGTRMIRPGVPVAEIAASVREALHATGLPALSWTSDLAGRVGHGIGLDITEPPHVSITDPTILDPGMVVSIEPGLATSFGLFHVEQNVAVTHDGHEILSTSPWRLRTLGS